MFTRKTTRFRLCNIVIDSLIRLNLEWKCKVCEKTNVQHKRTDLYAVQNTKLFFWLCLITYIVWKSVYDKPLMIRLAE